MKLSTRVKIAATSIILACAIFAALGERSLAQNEGGGGQAEGRRNREVKREPKPEPKVLPPDDYQRSAQVLYLERMGKEGADRGQEIYYMKCWICHNDYTRKADPKAAPTLKGVFNRAKLMSGDAVNDESVMKQIREGSVGMPAYKYVLTDKDMADLMKYLHDKCCWDENNPPANPRYKFQK